MIGISAFKRGASIIKSKNLSTMKNLINQEVNYKFLLNKLKCNNNCPCTKFVYTVKVEDIERYPVVWMSIAQLKKNEWCPIGPQPIENTITQEEEEENLQRELIEQEQELYYYRTEPNFHDEDLRRVA
jgi:hypothetical protein